MHRRHTTFILPIHSDSSSASEGEEEEEEYV